MTKAHDNTARPSVTWSPLLQVARLSVREGQPRRPLLVDVSLTVAPGQIVAVLGRSGAGKSTLARSLVGLLPYSTGTLSWQGSVCSSKRPGSWRALRRDVQLCWQDPAGTFDPRWRIRQAIEFARRLADRHPDRAAIDDIVHALALDGSHGERYPHELSGGQRQRWALVRALGCEPKLLIADEVTCHLDAVNEERVVSLLEAQRARGLAVVLITHDVDQVRRLADEVIVLELGRTVEHGPTSVVLNDPVHPVTQAFVEHRRARAAEVGWANPL